MTVQEVSALLKMARKSREMRQDSLAAELGVSQNTISLAERGMFSLVTLKAYDKYFGLNLDYAELSGICHYKRENRRTGQFKNDCRKSVEGKMLEKICLKAYNERVIKSVKPFTASRSRAKRAAELLGIDVEKFINHLRVLVKSGEYAEYIRRFKKMDVIL
jgi:transcriptional regulator with XRE-family HTH domain